ncbi:uncharacterized protein JCM6883_001270 [Sporobolomyces salmoneus]|uniref:uncharacterized protein n=1 Tax=Sporobolomyces salmoneus TaxID=183962 RepID=UPI00317718FE
MSHHKRKFSEDDPSHGTSKFGIVNDPDVVGAQIGWRLEKIVELLGKSELAKEWEIDAIDKFREFEGKIEPSRLLHLVEQLNQRLRSLRSKQPDALNTWDYFFTGYIPPFEDMALIAGVTVTGQSWFKTNAVHYCTLVATEVEDFSQQAEIARARGRYREQCLDALKQIERLAPLSVPVLSATRALRGMFEWGGHWQTSTLPGSASVRDAVHRAAKILVIVRETLKKVAKNGDISATVWDLWIPTPEQLKHATTEDEWKKLTEGAEKTLGWRTAERPAVRARAPPRTNKRRSQHGPSASANSLGSHFVRLNTRQHAIYFG